MAQQTYDVIIGGAGPVGLFLSTELARYGLSVLILEQEVEANVNWKAAPMGLRGLNTPSVELLYRRGLISDILGPERTKSDFRKTCDYQSGGHFAGLGINANMIDLEKFPYKLPGPALQPGHTTIERIETVLADRAVALGVTIHRGDGIAAIVSEDDVGVTIETRKKAQYTGRYLVGCDGGRSIIRKQSGFAFEGTEATITFYAVHCEFTGTGKLSNGCNITPNGVYVLGPGPNVVYIADFDNGAYDRKQELTREHLQSVLGRIRGSDDVSIGEIYSARTFTDRSKQATQYRRGRILLAGDAAHIHPPLGSQGLNAGFGDALNLGWKLASTIRQEKSTKSGNVDLTLLDTYETERKPIGNFVLEWTRSQVMILQPNLHSAAMRVLTKDLMSTSDGMNHFIDLAWGLSQRCNLRVEDDGTAHKLLGCSMPELELMDVARLGTKLQDGRGLLVEFGKESKLSSLVGKEYKGRLQHLALPVKDDLGLQALLVRPDGVVAWVAERDAEMSIAAAEKALRCWFQY